MLLHKQKVAAGANMWLQKPIYDYRSKYVTAGAMMWLKEQRCGCRGQNVAAGKSLKVISRTFVTILVFSDSLSLGAASLGHFFAKSQILFVRTLRTRLLI